VDRGERQLSANTPPPLRRLLGEARAIPELVRFSLRDRTAGLPKGDGHPVIVFPGFLAGDILTGPLRRRLGELGYWNAGWRFGTNFGLKPGLLTQMVHYVRSVNAGQRRPVSLIGWSLGGLYAREIAKRIPDRVRFVVTLGTPSTGDLHANNAWKLYERLNSHKVSAPPLDTDPGERPPVPLTSIMTPDDGIVAPACVDVGCGETWETVSVSGTHVGLVWNAEALRVIADRLAQPAGTWTPYRG